MGLIGLAVASYLAAPPDVRSSVLKYLSFGLGAFVLGRAALVRLIGTEVRALEEGWARAERGPRPFNWSAIKTAALFALACLGARSYADPSEIWVVAGVFALGGAFISSIASDFSRYPDPRSPDGEHLGEQVARLRRIAIVNLLALGLWIYSWRGLAV
jgi:hypothetical protein